MGVSNNNSRQLTNKNIVNIFICFRRTLDSMKLLQFHQTLKMKKNSPSTYKFISSHASPFHRNPTNYDTIRETNPNFTHPYEYFNQYRKSNKPTLKHTKSVHAIMLKMGVCNSDVFVGNSLIDRYCNSRDMVSAATLFDKIPERNGITWNILISGYNSNLLFDESWSVFCKMWWMGFNPNEFTYGSAVSACIGLQSVICGKQVYSLALKDGFFSNGYVRAGMIDLFSKNYRVDDALKVFGDVSCENVVCWNAIIAGLVRNGENWESIKLFSEMCSGALMPSRFTFSSVLTACAALKELEMGRGVQGWVIKCGASNDVFIGSALVDLYAKCGDMENAVKEFWTMPTRNVVSWTSIISGFVQMNDSASALRFFKEMMWMKEEINKFTATSILTACAELGILKTAIQIHLWIIKSGLYTDSAVKVSMIKMYSKLQAVSYSCMVFGEADSAKNLTTYAAMIATFAQNNNLDMGIELFIQMSKDGVKPDKYCSSSVLSVVDCLHLGRQIHCYIIKNGVSSDVTAASSLFTMYSKCGGLEESYEVFTQMLEKDNISWASMIAGFVEHGYSYRAIELFKEMLHEETQPDEQTFSAILNTCAITRSLQIGKEIHGHILRARLGGNTLVGGAIVNMYSKCHALDLAKMVFDMMPEKDPVSCSSLVSGYAQHGRIDEALFLFRQIWMTGGYLDSFTIPSVLGLASLFNRSDIVTQLHGYVIKVGSDNEVSTGSSLVTAYAKCGDLVDCWKAFDRINRPDLISWTIMIVSYAQHGKGAEALDLFERMKKAGIAPDSVTFVAVLSACSHTGLVEEGYFHFNSMSKDYNIEPTHHHYACMIDILGRSGRLKEAERFISSMPIEPNALVWGTLLAASKTHGDIELAKLAANKCFELQPCDVGAHVAVSNIFAEVGQWEEVVNIRSSMKGHGVSKEPAWSSV